MDRIDKTASKLFNVSASVSNAITHNLSLNRHTIPIQHLIARHGPAHNASHGSLDQLRQSNAGVGAGSTVIAHAGSRSGIASDWMNKWQNDTEWRFEGPLLDLSRFVSKTHIDAAGKLMLPKGMVPTCSRERDVQCLIKALRSMTRTPGSNPYPSLDIQQKMVTLATDYALAIMLTSGHDAEHAAILMTETLAVAGNLGEHGARVQITTLNALADLLPKMPPVLRKDLLAGMTSAYGSFSSAQVTAYVREDKTSLAAKRQSPQRQMYSLIKRMVAVRYSGEHSDRMKVANLAHEYFASPERKALKALRQGEKAEFHHHLYRNAGKSTAGVFESAATKAQRKDDRIALAPMWEPVIDLLPELSKKKQLQMLDRYKTETGLEKFWSGTVYDGLVVSAFKRFRPGLEKLCDQVLDKDSGLSDDARAIARKFLASQLQVLKDAGVDDYPHELDRKLTA
jgi:hypothetical protein